MLKIDDIYPFPSVRSLRWNKRRSFFSSFEAINTSSVVINTTIKFSPSLHHSLTLSLIRAYFRLFLLLVQISRRKTVKQSDKQPYSPHTHKKTLKHVRTSSNTHTQTVKNTPLRTERSSNKHTTHLALVIELLKNIPPTVNTPKIDDFRD